MELYPKNGKLLKVYGRYLEYVRNDPWTAGKFYGEALKLGTSESLLSLMAGNGDSSLTNGLEQVDEKVDSIIIINAAGVIMMANAVSVLAHAPSETDFHVSFDLYERCMELGAAAFH
jgi:hypothetical protein